VSARSEQLRIAVLGAGHLGSRHAERLAAAPAFSLVAVHDRDPARAEAAARRLGTRALSLPAAIEEAEAVVVATSTHAHFEAARSALAAGRAVLVEKPLTGRVEEALALVDLARERDQVLHVGQVERFNPALRRLFGRVPRPRFVESHRLASLVPRNLDLDVVQDLMIHDLDLTLALVGEDPESVEAVGISVITGRVDIANARIRFPGGAVANLTASRVSRERVRKFRMFLPGAYFSADCATGIGTWVKLRPGREGRLREALESGQPPPMEEFLAVEEEADPGPDALSVEHEEFRRAVRGEPNRGVPGVEAVRTLRAMVAVETAIARGTREGE
jgi:predicted dehydrogenase